MTDQHDPEGDPFHGVPREMVVAAQEAADKLGDAAHAVGLHIQQSDIGVMDGPDGEKFVVVAAHFLIGDLAWSDRVQDPQAEVDTDALAHLETEIMRDKATELRNRMLRKAEGDQGGDEGS